MKHSILCLGIILSLAYATPSISQSPVYVTTPTWNQLEQSREQDRMNRSMDRMIYGGQSVNDSMNQYLIEKGFDPSLVYENDSGGYQSPNWGTEEFRPEDPTALVRAAKAGLLEVVQSLVAKGSNVNFMDANKWSPLMAAINANKSEVADFLISKGANVNAKDQTDWTPLMLAAKNGKIDIVNSLLKNGADVSAKDSSGRTALDHATRNGYNNVADLLKQQSASK